ncbi:MAG: prepilin peptidase [Porphyrobacter sp. IPPAS B-1204]|nr:MAG: prepilin peptidase [Porphyrobacter sp. IPPAS B-1204]
MMPEGPVWLTGLLAAVAGAAIGSFIGTALLRLPADRSILSGRSACDACGVAIGARDLVPLWSWLALRGRCRACGAAIGVWQPGCEVAGALIGAAAVMLAPQGLALPAMLMGWQLLLLGVIDARHLWLPRSLVAVLALSGVAFALLRAWEAESLIPLGFALAGGALGFGMLWAVARGYRMVRGREGMGGGDPPMLGAVGLWLGPMGVIGTVIGASLIGLAAALVMLLLRREVAADTALPLGTLMAAAAWLIFLVGGSG